MHARSIDLEDKTNKPEQTQARVNPDTSQVKPSDSADSAAFRYNQVSSFM